MTSKEEISKQYLDIENPPKKIESKTALITPSFYNPLNFASSISEKNNYVDEVFNIFNFFKGALVYDIYNNGFFPGKNKFIQNSFLNWPLSLQSQKPSIRIPNYENNINYNENSFLFNYFLKEQEETFKENKNNINKNIIKNDNNYNYNFNCSYNFLNGNNINGNINDNINLKQKNWTSEKKINLNLNINFQKPKNNINKNTGKKFFINHNYGFKCSCSKAKCDRKYCKCFNSGNYCIDCNCKNCNNKPPVNSYTNKHPIDESSKNKKEKIICTCTKSGCNKNYCECHKNGIKCTSLCRCISCENNDELNNKKNNINTIFECCPENSIYIIKNDIYIEDIKNKIVFNISGTSAMKENLITLCKKRKRKKKKQ